MRVDPHYVTGLVSSLNDAQSTQQKLSAELSSGLRISLASDDPVAAGQAAALGTAVSRDDTFVQNAATLQSRIQVSDSALGGVVTQLTSALSLAVQGNNGTLNSTDLQGIAQQLSGIRDQVVSLANTSYQGTYLFAGSKGDTAPYAVDTSTSPATATYQGDTVAAAVTTPNGQKIQTALTGAQVFSASGADVFAALKNLIADFATGTPAASSVSDTAALTTALTNVSTQRATLDSSLSRIQSASTYTQTDATQRTAAQSTLISADTASVATQLSAVATQTQALMSVIAADEKGSLFDQLQ